jgi:hypothetical protein
MILTPALSVSPLGCVLVGMISIVLPVMVLAANLPLTDLIFFGGVHQKTSHAPIFGSLPGAIQVKTNSAIVPAGTVIESPADLLTASGDNEARPYVLRICRLDAAPPDRLDGRALTLAMASSLPGQPETDLRGSYAGSISGLHRSPVSGSFSRSRALVPATVIP